ncbi:MAG: hypothetical protein HFG05_03760 [Oscillibacter sp.]|nr:hypothetical protein [Oscillibacter sp.]
MKQTEDYQLNQWDLSDRVRMEDFNADNAKIAAALSGMEERMKVMERVVPNIVYYVGQLALVDFRERRKVLPNRAMHYWDFPELAGEVLIGGAAVKNGHLVLTGAGAKGSMTSIPYSIAQSGWTTIRLWTHHSGGKVTAAINGTEMERVRGGFATSVSGVNALEQEFIGHNDGKGSFQITLNLDCGTDASMSVEDYCLMAF